jgi:general stress protein 26
MDQEKQETQTAIERLLHGQSTVVLSTVNADGTPHATPLFYLAGDELEIYWFSAASSQHSDNLARDCKVAVAVYASTEHWKEICGAQMRGTVKKITDRALRREVTKRYCDRFHLGRIFRVALARSSLYVMQPSWIRYIDNSKRFGYRSEITLPTRL